MSLILKKKKNTLSVNTTGKFKVKKLGIDLMDYKTKTERNLCKWTTK